MASRKRAEQFNIIKDVINRPTSRQSDVTLLWGIAWLIIISIIGWYFRIAPMSIFGFIPVGYVSLLWHVVLNTIIWVVSCVLPFAYAMYINRKTRTVELFGRMLYAHWPAMLLMLPGIVGGESRIYMYSTYMSGLNRYNLAQSFELYPEYTTLMLIMTCVILIWYVYWSYNAFSGATKCKGLRFFALYILVVMCSQYLTAITLEEVYKSLLR